MKTLRKYETLTYVALWSLLFIAPVLSLYIRTATDAQVTFNWDEVLVVWRELAIYLALFLLHNLLLAPLLIYKQRRWTYFGAIIVVVSLFAFAQCIHKPDIAKRDGFRGPPPHERFEDRHLGPPHEGHRPPIIHGQHDIVATIILVLMFGMNLGIKLYFKTRKDQTQMAIIERQNLERQLEYLRYQINPHFFMNTLNNIHALVDIDPEEAKHTIVELSKLMRFVLYEGNKKTVPLSSELSFLQNYITLMSLRYTNMVDIKVTLPSDLPSSEVPPLLFVTFVENAFKHGISYQQPSFVDIEAEVVGHSFFFRCKNSKGQGERKEERGERRAEGGVGLRNARERLNLIYGDRYKLDISDTPSTYTVELIIPLSPLS